MNGSLKCADKQADQSQLLAFERCGNRVDVEEHRRRQPMERTFSDALQRHEPELLVEGDGTWLCVGDHSDAAHGIALAHRELEHVAQEPTSDPVTLGGSIHTQASEPENRERIGWHAPTLARAG